VPTYQYSCTECDHAFEQFQSFSDDALTVCPRCQGRLRKIFNAVGVVFKGSGFYRNDSRSDAKSAGAPAKVGSTSESNGSSSDTGSSSDGGSSGDSTTKTATGSETKPAKKAETSSSSTGSSSAA